MIMSLFEDHTLPEIKHKHNPSARKACTFALWVISLSQEGSFFKNPQCIQLYAAEEYTAMYKDVLYIFQEKKIVECYLILSQLSVFGEFFATTCYLC